MLSISGESVFPSADQRNSTGIVKITPPASDSPADPMVCTRLLSKTEFLFRRTRVTASEMTAAGIEADTVMPTRRPR